MPIFKYDINAAREPTPMPAGASILAVGEQDGRLVVWADVDPQAGDARRRLLIVMTGEDRPDGAAYVGTVSVPVNVPPWRIVTHIFDDGE